MGDGKSKQAAGDSGVKEKKKRPTGLGKGLDALFPDMGLGREESTGNLLECDVDKIHPNPYQPRRDFPENEMAELAESVKVQGILQSLLVRESPGAGYELIAG
ncbi:MAG: chromosome partitioning protein ParB, partial [Desulfobacterales bacterium CG23_combo_of_CG06-09_8_20_14_all_51_8]